MAGTPGLEPGYLEPKSSVLPLDNIPVLTVFMAGAEGFEPPLTGSEPAVLTAVRRSSLLIMAGQGGFEPPTGGFGDRCATSCATALYGDTGRDRTATAEGMNLVLYQLSYSAIWSPQQDSNLRPSD